MYWRWSSSGSYSAASVYKIMVSGGMLRWRFDEIWKGRAPPKVKIFTYLLLQDRILIHEVMERRGIPCQLQCVMCTSSAVETSVHLVYQCQYAQQVWSRIENKWGVKLVNNTILVPDSIPFLWQSSWQVIKRLGNMSRKEWAVHLMGVSWHLWLQRNELIFRGKSLPAKFLADRAWGDGESWLKWCGEQQYRGGEK